MKDLFNPDYYVNREESWLEFDDRVLEEAINPDNPILEKAKFLGITLSNLDEFFMVRMARILEHQDKNDPEIDAAGWDYPTQKKQISKKAHTLMDEVYEIGLNRLIPELAKVGFQLADPDHLSEQDRAFLSEKWKQEIKEKLSISPLNSSSDSTAISSRSLQVVFRMKNKEWRVTEESVCFSMEIPSALPRLYELPGGSFLRIEEVILLFLQDLFPDSLITDKSVFRLTRSTRYAIPQESGQALLAAMEMKMRMQAFGRPVRLEIPVEINPRLSKHLMDVFDLTEEDVYREKGFVDISVLAKAGKFRNLDKWKKKDLESRLPLGLEEGCDLFKMIRRKDILLHHPYESFQPVVRFLQAAASDSAVLSIKQTLYRVSSHSPIIEALISAAQNGKQVTVLMEVKARFDENNNLQWVQKLEAAGCRVLYGLPGLKTHCKITMVVRKEGGLIRRYLHLGTGNYNDVTAGLYTDLGMLTCRDQFGLDGEALFSGLEKGETTFSMKKLAAAPEGLRSRFDELIDREICQAREGKKAKIIAKMNSLQDPEIIRHLYEASCAGVQIDLIVRGICCLKPGIPGVSENIRVRSIVGWLLEHSRIYCFYNGGQEEFFLSSADWMPRNLDRRVELMFPVEDRTLQKRLKKILKVMLQDNQSARSEDSDGHFHRISRHYGKKINSQRLLEQQTGKRI